MDFLAACRRFVRMEGIRLRPKPFSPYKVLSDIGLDPRTAELLKRANIHTIEDAVSKTTRELLLIPHFGTYRLKLLDTALKEAGHVRTGSA